MEISEISPDNIDDNSIEMKIKYKDNVPTDVNVRVNKLMELFKASIKQKILQFNLEYSTM